ncbi:hypothetical protein QBC40DRAFT_284295 [Triangularia verruculosa]|uniref:DUF2828 domain-containing protein n=1 Tax=Triangularia verruculosa TaxID=2587418 RepID=A0AAN7AUM3_9PEZI|nr:hypothetical protein QBC40DRAFT_284295 [Triangularia verruculosa]
MFSFLRRVKPGAENRPHSHFICFTSFLGHPRTRVSFSSTIHQHHNITTATMTASTDNPPQENNWFLQSKCPVLLPQLDALRLSQEEFVAYLKETLKRDTKPVGVKLEAKVDVKDESHPAATAPSSGSAFMDGLLSHKGLRDFHLGDDKMLTENGDVTFASSKNVLVDLFTELEEVIDSKRLDQILTAAWKEDPLITLKIIFNARSIHLGKSSRISFYRCAGWLAEHHPLTLVSNIHLLSSPVIPKPTSVKKEKGDEDADDDLVMVEAEMAEDDALSLDVVTGLSHGYWKDLLNILALAANSKLDVHASPRDILNVKCEAKPSVRYDQEKAKEKRAETRIARHEQVIKLLESNATYRALHLTVSRLFAGQLKKDITLLRDGDGNAKKQISLCGKWAPSTDRFHDKHTFAVSTIAELMYPSPMFSAAIASDREVYLRHARETYRKDVSALRKHLDIVERNLSANTLDKIKYERVPSVAMNNYTPIFASKDEERFMKYLDNVSAGKTQISGATLLPSTLIKAVRETHGRRKLGIDELPKKKRTFKEMKSDVVSAATSKVVDGQWKTLVQRIKDSGTLESSMAVCDVSGSMMEPVFRDGTNPMDSAIGLSLLVAEVTQPPFGGAFITFSTNPKVEKVDLSKGLAEKYEQMVSAEWGGSTDFCAVFSRLILPMAIENAIKPEHMVKRVFVFSDMHFNSAQYGSDQWSSSFERIQQDFKEAGYEMPELVFWNLAGGRQGYDYSYDIAPKPVAADQVGTALVSGYSQGMLKVFLGGAGFDELKEEEEDEMAVVVTKDGDEITTAPEVKRGKDPFDRVKQAISHKAYSGLVVVD